MAKPNLTSIYTSANQYSVLKLLQALCEAVDDIDYTPTSTFTDFKNTVNNKINELETKTNANEMGLNAVNSVVGNLLKGISSDGKGNISIGKNLEIDGNVLTLNGKQWGIMPIVFVEGSTYTNAGFLFTDRFPLKNDLTQGDLEDIGGIWVNTDEDTMGICAALETISQTTDNTKIENGILYLNNVKADGQANSDYYNFSALFKGFVTDANIEIAGDIYFQKKLYRHIIQVAKKNPDNPSDIGIHAYLIFYSTNNLKADSLQDLTTLLKPTKGYRYPIYPGFNASGTFETFESIGYANNIWAFYKGDKSASDIINSVSDIVTTLG